MLQGWCCQGLWNCKQFELAFFGQAAIIKNFCRNQAVFHAGLRCATDITIDQQASGTRVCNTGKVLVFEVVIDDPAAAEADAAGKRQAE